MRSFWRSDLNLRKYASLNFTIFTKKCKVGGLHCNTFLRKNCAAISEPRTRLPTGHDLFYCTVPLLDCKTARVLVCRSGWNRIKKDLERAWKLRVLSAIHAPRFARHTFPQYASTSQGQSNDRKKGEKKKLFCSLCCWWLLGWPRGLETNAKIWKSWW